MPHENDPLYIWPSDEFQPPEDLAPYFREFKPGYMGYICPNCRTVYAPGFAGMPEGFRTHIKDLDRTGCTFNPKSPIDAKVQNLNKLGGY